MTGYPTRRGGETRGFQLKSVSLGSKKHNQYTNYTSLNKTNEEIFAVIANELPSLGGWGSHTMNQEMTVSIVSFTLIYS